MTPHTFCINFFVRCTSSIVLFQPLVRTLPERFNGTVAVATADVDTAAELADDRDVTTIPHFILLKNGVQVCALGFRYFRIDRADWLGQRKMPVLAGQSVVRTLQILWASLCVCDP